MAKVVTLVFVISSVLQSSSLHPVSASSNDLSLKFDPGKVYQYSYQTQVLLNDAGSRRQTRPQKDVGVKLSVDFSLATVYRDADLQMFKLKVTKAKLSSAIRPELVSDLDDALSLPVYFQLRDDQIEGLHFAQKDPVFSRNVKKGILSLFQVQTRPGQRTEVDVSGECQVTYSTPDSSTVEKVKSDCQNLEIAGQFTNPNKALGVTVYSKSTQIYKLKNSVIESVSGTQKVLSYLNIRSALNGAAAVSQDLKLESVQEGSKLAYGVKEVLDIAAKEIGSGLSLSLLPSEEESKQCRGSKCESSKKLAEKYVEDLKADKLATLPSAKAFVHLLKSFRQSGKTTIAQVLTSENSYYIVPQLIDIATAVQTEASREALLELLNFEDADSVEYPQRFLFAAAYSSHPTESLITDLLSVLKKPIPNDSLRESLLLSLGAIVHTFCQINEQSELPVVKEFETLVTSALADCKEEPCKLMYLRALGNAGLRTTASVILPYAESPTSAMLASTAISAFRRLHGQYITKEVKEALVRIFHQIKFRYDTSVRVAALELLLEHEPTDVVIRDVVLSCLDQTNAEYSTYIIKMLLDAAASNPVIGDQVRRVLRDPSINNYQVLAQKGKSSVITSFLAKMKDVNSTYNLYFENSASGVMKRSGMVVNLQGKTIKQPFMKFGIYADGLESLVGNEETSGDAEGSEAVEPTAGMSFTFMDVLLTQVEFFRGTSGLMSAVWSAPSDLTSALQGNLLLQDHAQRVHLSNGLVLDTQVLGALSMDLSGFVSISLWNRNCEALIRNSGALYLEGSLSIASKYLNVGVTFSGEGESNIDYTSNADFYEMPLKLCMEMKRPEFQFKKTVESKERLRQTKTYRSRRTTKSRVSGESYFLNQANSNTCRVMLA